MASARVTIPIAGAVLCTLGVLGFLWWQLPTEQQKQQQQTIKPLAQVIPSLNPLPTSTDTIDARDEALLHLRKGDLLAARGQWSDASDEYQKAVEAKGGLPALTKLAQAQLQKRDVAGARITADHMKRAGAKNEDLVLLQSIIELRTGELQKAEAILDAATDSPQKAYGLALLAIMREDSDAAKQELTIVSGGWEPVLRSYAKTLQGAYDEYALFPQSPTIHLTALLGRALAQVQECELALPLLAKVTQQQDDYRDAWIVRGYCELTSGRTQDSLASLEKAYQIDPEKPETQYFLARAYSATGDHNNAITFLQYALQNGFQPESELRQTLANEAVEAGNTSLAIEQLDALTALPDATVDEYAQFVNVSLTINQKEGAYVKAAEAARKWPSDASAQVLLAKAALATGRKEDAKIAVQKALQLDPQNADAAELTKQL